MQNENKNLLTTINTPTDLRKLPKDKLPQVCDELRQFIIEEVSNNPGHLGSSLGAVEFTVALHYVFNTPYDLLVWDVGHQAYGHKILTERRDKFHTNRKFKGISGFPNPAESIYDTFTAGHASNSISAALGMSVAALQSEQEKDKQVIAIIGDGALSGGLAFEGLNNASSVPNNLLIILNDNHMAIDPIHGGINEYLLDITTSKTYNRIRYEAYRALRKLGLMNEQGKAKVQRIFNTIKATVSHQNNIFEGMNIRYFGPVDGHDVKGLVRILQDIKDFKGPKVIHLITKKGKGYKPAEDFATEWHAPGKFNKDTGERIEVKSGKKTPPVFQDVFGSTLLELAKQNSAIVGVTPAMPTGCSMTIMSEEMPARCFDVGIAEGHAVTFSAGLAREGKIPFCNIYSSFMQRAYDNVIHDIAIQNLPVVLCLDRAGIVGSDGVTHHGAFDLAYLRCIPNLTIASPYNEIELRNLMYTAQLSNKGAFAIRYPRGIGYEYDWRKPLKEIQIGTGRCIKEGKDIAILSLGPIGNTVAKAIENIEQTTDLNVAHYDLRFIKPLDEKLLHEIATKFARIITVEDGVLKGGFGSAILEFMADNNYHLQIKRLGLPDHFVEHGSPQELYHELGLDEEGIQTAIQLFTQEK
jgi:1-deoxy-D-xylulose-5-phosphate synthase